MLLFCPNSFIHSPFSSLLDRNVCLMVLFPNILTLSSSLKPGDHVLQPYSRTDDIIVLYISVLKFFGRSRGDKTVWTE